MSVPQPSAPSAPVENTPFDPRPFSLGAPIPEGPGIPSHALLCGGSPKDRLHHWQRMHSLIPCSVLAAIQDAKLPAMPSDRIPTNVPEAWSMRSSRLDILPCPNLAGLEWAFPELPLAEWHRRYQEKLLLLEWQSSPQDSKEDWRFLAQTHRGGVKDQVVEPAQPQHPPLEVAPGPQTWLSWLGGQGQEAQPFLILMATEETLVRGDLRRLHHLDSGQSLSVSIATDSLLLDLEDDNQIQLCRLFQDQRRVFMESPPDTSTKPEPEP